jgi:hypothetical protein
VRKFYSQTTSLENKSTKQEMQGKDGLDAGCWMLVAGCWLLDAGCWLQVAGSFCSCSCYSSYSYSLLNYRKTNGAQE